MTPAPHQMPAHIFSALARGGGGDEAMRLIVAARRSKTLLLVRVLVDTASEIDHTDAATARHAYRALARIQQAAPHAVDQVLDYPSVGAWAIRTVLLLRRGAAAATRPGNLAAVAAAAAVRGAVPITIRFAADPSRWTVSLPSLGFALVRNAGEEVFLRSGRDGTELVTAGTSVAIPLDPHQDGPCWRGLRRIAVDSHGQRTDFLLDEWADSHLAPELSAREHVSDPASVEQWRGRIAAGWDLLVHQHQEVAREVAAVIGVLTPLRAPPSGRASVSATLHDALGCVFLSLPPDAQSAAVTLAHELQHAKLSVVMDLFSLLESDTGKRFYAPWRNDPRSVMELLNGTYAHLGVTAFWRRQRGHEESAARAQQAHIEYVRWRRAARDTASSLLASGRLTATGRLFVAGMAQVLDEWNSDTVPDEALELAVQLSDEHRAQWLAAHSDPNPRVAGRHGL